MNKLFNIFAIVISFVTIECYGQDVDTLLVERDSTVLITGQLVSLSSKESISLGHIINTRTGSGVVSDIYGFFRIKVLRGDTLHISRIGYEMYDYVMPALQFDSTHEARIFIPDISYSLSPVNIIYLGTYQQMKFRAMNYDLPRNDTAELQLYLSTLAHDIATSTYAMPTHSGVGMSFALDFPNEYQRQLRALEAFKGNQAEGIRVGGLLTEANVEVLTGLKGAEAKVFILYCYERDQIRYGMAGLEILKLIKHLYEEYLVDEEFQNKYSVD